MFHHRFIVCYRSRLVKIQTLKIDIKNKINIKNLK